MVRQRLAEIRPANRLFRDCLPPLHRRTQLLSQVKEKRTQKRLPMQQTSSTLRGFDFVMYLVDDMKRARQFYEELFALTLGATDSEYFVEYDLPDGGAFALARDPSAAREPSGGAMFGVTDAEAAITRVEQLGGKMQRR